MKRFLGFLLAACMLLGLLFALPASAEDAPPVLYVTDGLVMWLDAYDPDNGTVDLSSGTWQSKVGTTQATLRGTWTKGARGIGYALSSVPGTSEKNGTGIDLGFENLTENFTVDMAITPHGLTNGQGEKVTYDTKYGISYPYGFAFGAFKGYVYPAQRAASVNSPTADDRYCTDQIMWYHAAVDYDSNFNWLRDDYALNTNLDRPFQYTVTGTAGKFEMFSNAVKDGNVNISSFTPKGQSDGLFQVLCCFPSDVFSVRVYNRVLTAAELEQNHFADLCAYLDLNVASRVAMMPASRRAELFHTYAGCTFDEPGLAAQITAECAKLMPGDLRVPDPTTDAERRANAFADIAEQYALDLSPLVSLTDADRQKIYDGFATLETGLPAATLQTMIAVFAGNAEALFSGVLGFEGVSLRTDANDGVRFSFRLDRRVLALVEGQGYTVTAGAVVARASRYSGETLTVAKDGSAPEKAAAVTVYRTDGAEVGGHFLPDDPDAFAVTVVFGDLPRVSCYPEGIVARGFVILEKDGEERIVYVDTATEKYGGTPSYQSVAKADYLANKGDETAMAEYADCLQADLSAYYEELAGYPVYYVGSKAHKDGEVAVWVEELPDRQPWRGSTDPERANIRAIYVYYPMAKDPSTMSDNEKAAAGVMRVFGYIGYPNWKGDDEYSGIVCVHGGAGHAYANYVLEAVKEGFSAIALDTEGCVNTTGGNTTYNEAEASYVHDTFGHLGKDNFSHVTEAFEKQWLYWAVGDTILANSVLRADAHTVEDEVGLTGISWGGLITSTTVCYDYRFRFCVPVYIAFHMAESVSYSVGGLPSNAFAAALWQDAVLLGKSPVPVLMLASDRDHFSSINCNIDTYHDLQNGTLIIRPNYGHSQQAGAAPAEIYRFASATLGQSGGFVTAKEQPTAEMGRKYTLEVNVPKDLSNVIVTLYYRTSPIPSYGQEDRPAYSSKVLDYSSLSHTVKVDIPSDAYLYYISFTGYSDTIGEIKTKGTAYGNADGASSPGRVYSSTEIVVLGDGGITK